MGLTRFKMYEYENIVYSFPFVLEPRKNWEKDWNTNESGHRARKKKRYRMQSGCHVTPFPFFALLDWLAAENVQRMRLLIVLLIWRICQRLVSVCNQYSWLVVEFATICRLWSCEDGRTFEGWFMLSKEVWRRLKVLKQRAKS